MKTARLFIDGMYCAACGIDIERALHRLPGVTSANISTLDNSAIVCFNEADVTLPEIVNTIEQSGYGAVEYTYGSISRLNKEKEKRLLRKVLLSLMLSIPLVWAIPLPLKVVLATVVQFYIGADFYRDAFRGLKNKTLNMSFMVAFSTTCAWGYSLFSFLRDRPEEVYFDSAALIITMVLTGRLIETKLNADSGSVLERLYEQLPQKARLLKDGVETEADVSTLSVGDVLLVREGDRIPLDGTLRSGIGFVDESMLSGEAVPVRKETGDPVYAGTINTEGSFSFEATADREHTLMSDIIVDVEASFAQKSRLQNRTDRVVRWFCPAVILLALLAALAWFLFLSPGDLPKAARVLISVIIVACPCALGVAVPLSVSSAVSAAAGKGVVIKESQVVEQLGEVSWVGFDKTGTLTNGRFDVTDIILLRAPSVEAMLLDAALAEKQSYHPLAEAVLRESGLRPEEIPTADDLRSVPGKGVIAIYDGSTIVVGSLDFVAEQGAPGDDLETIAKQLGDQQKSVIVICKDGAVEGACFLTDELRPEAAEAVRDLEAMDVSVALLTGDSEGATLLAAEQAGISDVRARQLPEDKSARLRAEQERGAVTAMVGDGLNDVPSLARADVGFELGGKTALAGDTANVVILDGDLRKVPWSLQLGRKAVRNIRQNLVLSCVYNVVALSVAAAGLLNPIVAAAAMSLSSISVVLNATRVRRGSH